MTETFQITQQQAEAYEELFVPALFGEWAPRLCDLADLRQGQRVLDVACGTGVVAREARTRVGPSGQVTGLDLNPAMLDVAARVGPDIEWRQGDAGALPFDDAQFDRVLCSAALFFFPDVAEACAEMARVTVPGGTAGILTFAGLADQPGYGPFVDLVVRHAGPGTAEVLATYWSQGDADALARTLADVGLDVVETRTRLGTAHFPSTDAIAEVEIKGTPLADRVPAEVFDRIVRELRGVLAPYVTSTGSVELPIRAILVAARRR